MEESGMKRAILGLLLYLVLSTAMAGPLRDYLREQRQIREDAEWGEEADATQNKGLPEGSRVLRNLAYGENERQRMDVYLPPHPDKSPVIFMVHGGAWRTGDKAMGRVVDNKIAHWLPLGYIFVSVNYRLLPDADPLVQADDVRRALIFAQNHAPEWGGNPDAFMLMGHSAGAHLVSLINAAPRTALAMGARPWRGVVSLDTAAMDIVATMQAKHYRFYDKAFGDDPSFWRAASPRHQIGSDAVPMLAVCSTKRPDHPCPATQDFAGQAKLVGARVEVMEQPLNHAEINGELGKDGRYTKRVEDFISSLLPVAP
jgi:arylformamidase